MLCVKRTQQLAHLINNCDISDLIINGYDFVNCVSYSKHTSGVRKFISKNAKCYKYVNFMGEIESRACFIDFVLDKIERREV